MSPVPIRVLVCDDSAVVRGLLTRAIESAADLVVAGSAMHGQAALQWLRSHQADVMVCDVEMPVMDGLETLKRVQAEYPQMPVIMASSLTHQGAEATVSALALGAVACVGKPVAANAAQSVELLSRELVPLLRQLGRKAVQPISRTVDRRPPVTPGSTRPATPPRGFRPEIMVIGSSTGGPRALEKVLCGLPSEFDLPVLIVQHMPPMFTPMLARHIEQDTGRPSAEGTHGGKLVPGQILIAPGDQHMTVVRTSSGLITHLNRDEPEHFCRPSVNPLFRSAASCCGGNVIAVMLTGMGEDGIEGTHSLRDAGAFIIAQDEATSVVWGMPGAVARAGLANQILPLDRIADSVSRASLSTQVTA